jgi:hypothetical protein
MHKEIIGRVFSDVKRSWLQFQPASVFPVTKEK